jgi:hypothetical protein
VSKDTMGWRKASASTGNGQCVELLETPSGDILMRNSRVPDGEILTFTRAEVLAFIEGCKTGDFDDLAE